MENHGCVAATWQITILAGLLLTPLFGQKIPGKQFGMTLLISTEPMNRIDSNSIFWTRSRRRRGV
ncbi:MAG: multidrug resistance efflux transporter family protein [Streptococcus sp.]